MQTRIDYKMVTGISVVIPNFNGHKLLEQIIPTILDALSEIKLDWEIIVSDDCSTDDSLAFLYDQYPFVRTSATSINAGFSPTINRGILMAVYSHVLLLNSDVKLTPSYFKPMISYFNEPDTFGVMGRVIGWDDEKLQGGGKYPHFQGLKLKTSRSFIPADAANGEQFYYSLFLDGANALVDRKKLLMLGGFDELFAPFYIEDVDLSIRAWRLGWKCYYEHNSVCRHKISASIKSTHKRNSVRAVYDRNKMYLQAIHLSSFKRLVWFFQLGIETLVRLVFFNTTWIKAIIEFIRNYDGVRESRRQLMLVANDKPMISLEEVVTRIQSSLQAAKVNTF